MSYEIELKPTENHLNEIKKWLKIEYDTHNDGFIRHWSDIIKAFERNQLIIYLKDKKSIGFVCYTELNEIAEIDLFCIKRTLRGKGYGGNFQRDFVAHLKEKQIIAVHLICSPEESKKFWIKESFQQTPITPSNEEKMLRYWKPIMTSQKTTSHPNNLNKIELWEGESPSRNKTSPRWTWGISPECLNIIQYAHSDWHLRITINGKIIDEGRVKLITEKRNEFIKAPFIFIPQHVIQGLLELEP